MSNNGSSMPATSGAFNVKIHMTVTGRNLAIIRVSSVVAKIAMLLSIQNKILYCDQKPKHKGKGDKIHYPKRLKVRCCLIYFIQSLCRKKKVKVGNAQVFLTLQSYEKSNRVRSLLMVAVL